MAHAEILQRVNEEPGLRINEIAERHRMSKNSVSVIVQQMVERGLVERTHAADDRRAVSVTITSLGVEILESWLNATNARVNVALAHLSEAQRSDIVAAIPSLSALVEHLEKADPDSLQPAGEAAASEFA